MAMRSAFSRANRDLYSAMYRGQSAEFVGRMRRKYAALRGFPMTMPEGLRLLGAVIDNSDPDTSLPNIEHAYQAARAARRLRPDDAMFQVATLIHDVGKIVTLFDEVPDWATVGDTFVVGEALPRTAPFHQLAPPRVVAPLPGGGGDAGGGLANALVSWGHDEYMFQVLRQNSAAHALPPRYWNAIRFHSLYAWHTHGYYRHLMSPADHATLRDVQALNACDLYSKDDLDPVGATERERFDTLLSAVFPEPLCWLPADASPPAAERCILEPIVLASL